MYYIYVLRSLKNQKRYVGYTLKDVFQRLKEHNNHSSKWTKQNGPFRLIYFEEHNIKTEAIKRERFLKSGQGRKWLDNNVKE